MIQIVEACLLSLPVSGVFLVALCMTAIYLVISRRDLFSIEDVLNVATTEQHLRAPLDVVPSTKMTSIYNPFVLLLNDNIVSSIEGGANLVMTVLEACTVQCCWGACIQGVHKIINEADTSGSDIFERIRIISRNGNTLYRFHICDHHQLFESCPLTPEYLGPAPRTHYPLVVTVTTDGDIDCDAEPYVVTMVTIFHIGDRQLCPGKSRILAQYIKTNHNTTHCLQKLYVSSNGCDDVYSTGSQSECVVCHAQPVTRAIVPCGHASVCSDCFPNLTQCPMCRGKIQSYFSMEEPFEVVSDDEFPHDSSIWQRFNTRLNDILGFRR